MAALLTMACARQGSPQILAVMQAEDRRAIGDGDLALIIEALGAEELDVRRVAVRTLGRLESNVHLAVITETLRTDPDPTVRATAAWAVAQTLSRGAGIQGVAPLVVALRNDADPAVRSAAATSLGRLRYDGGEPIVEALDALLDATYADHTDPIAGTDPAPERGAANESICSASRADWKRCCAAGHQTSRSCTRRRGNAWVSCWATTATTH